MYSKFFLVFFSLLLLMISGLAESFQKVSVQREQTKKQKSCSDTLLPVSGQNGFTQLVLQVSCEK